MLPAQANSMRGGEVAESDEWQAVSKQKTVVEILAQPSINWNSPHCALMPLNHPLLTQGLCQAGTAAGTASVGMVMGHCWRKRPSAYPSPKRAAAHRALGTHYPVWHCVTLWVWVRMWVRIWVSFSNVFWEFWEFFQVILFWYSTIDDKQQFCLFLQLFLLWDKKYLKRWLVKGLHILSLTSFFCPYWDNALWRRVQTELNFPFTDLTTAAFVLSVYVFATCFAFSLNTPWDLSSTPMT